MKGIYFLRLLEPWDRSLKTSRNGLVVVRLHFYDLPVEDVKKTHTQGLSHEKKKQKNCITVSSVALKILCYLTTY
jgi:hypothetical protein